ncbi:hypothetical protein QTP86_008674 [Hemibagrus guttatus]|nr:hypothetical protein QTP86_008674 [Hemibagrus guttatus]
MVVVACVLVQNIEIRTAEVGDTVILPCYIDPTVAENQMPDNAGEIRLWRNLFITLGMVIGVVVLAVTVSITSCCGKTKSPNCDVKLLEVTGTQTYLCAVELLNVSQRSRTNELGVYYCIQTGSSPDISSGIRLYIQNHSAENQTSTNDECQDQMPDKSGEIRLWRNLFITLGMVIGVVVLAVTVSITSCCGKTKSPNCDVELLEVTGTQFKNRISREPGSTLKNAGEIRLWRNLFITLGMVIGVVVLAVTENQTSNNEESQDQTLDKSGEIRLWRNLFITLGMVIGVVVLAVTGLRGAEHRHGTLGWPSARPSGVLPGLPPYENQTSTNDECQDQMPDKSGEIRLWRNLFITLGMVIGVVVLAVTALVQCVHVVHSVAGETVTLPCPTSQIKLDGHNVYWRFNDSMTVCDIIRGEVDFDEQHAMYKGKVKYFPGELKGNFSIQLLDVNSAHHGIYTCIIPNVATEMKNPAAGEAEGHMNPEARASSMYSSMA